MIAVLRATMKWLLVMLLAQLCALASAYHFLGKQISESEWADNAETLRCFTNDGDWMLRSPEAESQMHSCNVAPVQLNCTVCTCSSGNKYDFFAGRKCGRRQHYISADVMCSVMDGRSIGVVGDSMSYHSVQTISRELVRSMGQCTPATTHDPERKMMHSLYISIIPCKAYGEAASPPKDLKDFHVIHIRNDYLTINDEAPPNWKSVRPRIHFDPWTKNLDRYNISLLILNRGAHYVPDSLMLPQLERTFKYLQENHPNVTVLYRNTPEGHSNHSELFHSAPLADHQSADTYNPAHHWQHFAGQNEKVSKLLSERFPGVLLMDVYKLTSLRADGHMDPLHYCADGPVNYWADVLYQTIEVYTLSADAATAAESSSSLGLRPLSVVDSAAPL